MGWNTTVVVLNDALGSIQRDPNFPINLVRAIHEAAIPSKCPVEVDAGGFCRAAVVVESHHAQEDVLVRVGHNTGEVVDRDIKPGNISQVYAEIRTWVTEVAQEDGIPSTPEQKAAAKVLLELLQPKAARNTATKGGNTMRAAGEKPDPAEPRERCGVGDDRAGDRPDGTKPEQRDSLPGRGVRSEDAGDAARSGDAPVASTAVVWADEAIPFSGAQVKALLEENERLRAATVRVAELEEQAKSDERQGIRFMRALEAIAHGAINPASVARDTLAIMDARRPEGFDYGPTKVGRPESAGSFGTSAERHPDTERVLKLLIQRVGGAASMTEHDLARASRYQLRWTGNGHTTEVIAVADT